MNQPTARTTPGRRRAQADTSALGLDLIRRATTIRDQLARTDGLPAALDWNLHRPADPEFVAANPLAVPMLMGWLPSPDAVHTYAQQWGTRPRVDGSYLTARAVLDGIGVEVWCRAGGSR